MVLSFFPSEQRLKYCNIKTLAATWNWDCRTEMLNISFSASECFNCKLLEGGKLEIFLPATIALNLEQGFKNTVIFSHPLIHFAAVIFFPYYFYFVFVINCICDQSDLWLQLVFVESHLLCYTILRS